MEIQDSIPVSIEYLTAGCNNETGIFDESDGFLIYASGKNVLITKIPSSEDPIMRPITCALPHAAKGRVHSCQWIKLNNILGALVSSDDGFIRYYVCDLNSQDPLLYNCWSLKLAIDLGSAVTLVSWVSADSSAFVSAVTVKGEIYFIKLSEGVGVGSAQLVRSYSPKKVTAVSVGILPGTLNSYFIVAALSDSNIRLLTRSEEDLISWKEELNISGHQNWVTSLSVKIESDDCVLILSSSLDKTIRVWKIQLASVVISCKKLSELVPQKNTFTHNSNNYSLLADSLALGHDNAVYFARFFSFNGSIEILSGSSDRSLIVWSRGFGGAWKTNLQLGDLNGSLGTIGTDHTFSFYGGIIYKKEWIVASASTGSILFWKNCPNKTTNAIEWIPQIPITGHSDKVESITWAPSSESSSQFLVTASKDQTTRIFASSPLLGYREIARPQIHGYDLKCIAVTTQSTSKASSFLNFELISGADEKVIRVFYAPKQFYRKLGLSFDSDNVPECAELPALGLSNKISSVSEESKESSVNNLPENEGDLVRNSLWPEVDKLYGHNQEICSLAISSNGKLMSSSAKSHLVADAALRVWKRETDADNVSKWIPTFIVPAHTLTVSCLVFSPNSSLLLSVSRDRNFCIISPENGSILSRHEAHSRMIFSADWITDKSFITGSRDKTIKFWKLSDSFGLDDSTPILVQTINFENGITSVAALNETFIAAGDEVGNIFILKQSIDSWNILDEFTVKGGGGLGPADSITDLKWNPSESSQLAVASADNSIRILRFYL